MDSERHRQLQLALRAGTLRQVLALWPLFDLERLAETWPALRQALATLIAARHTDSVGLASAYYRAARLDAGVTGTAPIVLASLPSAEQLAISLDVVGLFGARRLLAQGRRDVAAQTLVKVSGAVGRHVLNGGRDTVLQSMQADPKARGWRRITSGKPCSFCSLLAGRGAVYGKDSVDFAAHDHCSCSAEPSWDQAAQPVRQYTPSTRPVTPEQRSIRNERVRAFIDANDL